MSALALALRVVALVLGVVALVLTLALGLWPCPWPWGLGFDHIVVIVKLLRTVAYVMDSNNIKVMGTHCGVTITILKLQVCCAALLALPATYSSSRTCSRIIMRPHRAHNVQFIAGTHATLICNSYELDQCPIWDTRRLDAWHQRFS